LWAVAVASACAWVAGSGTVARAAQPDWCDPSVLRSARVSVRLEVRRQRFDDWIATSTTTVRVPLEWSRTKQLMWEAEEGNGQMAMRCLFGAPDADERHSTPTVAVDHGTVVVTDVVRLTVNEPHLRERLGPWQVNLALTQWSFSLVPDALPQAHWTSVTVASAIPVEQAEPVPDHETATGTLSWLREPGEGPPKAEVRLRPPGQLALAAWLNRGVQWLIARWAWGAADLLVYLLVLFVAIQLGRQADWPDGSDGALTWLVTSVWLLFVGHLLVFAGSVVTEAGWGELGLGDAYGNAVAAGESAGWVVVLAAAAVLAWWPWLTGRLRLAAMVVVSLLAAACVAGLVLVWSAMRGADWRPGLATPLRVDNVPIVVGVVAGLLRVDNVPIVVGVVAGLLALAVYAGVIMRVWRSGWKPDRGCDEKPDQGNDEKPARTPPWPVAVAVVVLGALLAVLVPLQFAAYLLAQLRTTRWLWNSDSDWDWLWDDVLTYPRWMVSDVVVFFLLWTVVVLAVLAVLRQRTLTATSLTKDDQHLGALLFVLVTVYWPDRYAGLYFPLAPLVAFGVLVVLFRWWRPPGIPDHSKAITVPTADLVTQAASYNDLEARARRLEQQWSSGAPELKRESYEQQRKQLRAEVSNSRDAVHLGSGSGATPVDLYLTNGREDSPWRSAVDCAKDKGTIVAALLATLLMLLFNWQDNRWKMILNGWLGPAQLLINVAGELIFWFAMAFVLGLLWRALPGRRGFVKPMPLIAAWSAGAAAHYLMVRWLGQTASEDAIPRILLMFVVLTLVAVVKDVHSLDEIRDAWTSRLGFLATVYRVGPAGTTAAFLLAQVAAAFALWQQLRSGVGGEPLPPSPRSGR
jgi:hypothetical protein